MAHTLSFTVLDHLYPLIGPIHKNIKDLSEASIRSAVREVVSYYLTHDEDNDPSYYFSQDNKWGWGSPYRGVLARYEEDGIVQHLMHDNYCSVNRYNKYYVIAFAIDFLRFEVFSKDCDKKRIKWRRDDSSDPVIHNITCKNYNENPVIRLMKTIHNVSNQESDELSEDSDEEEVVEDIWWDSDIKEIWL